MFEGRRGMNPINLAGAHARAQPRGFLFDGGEDFVSGVAAKSVRFMDTCAQFREARYSPIDFTP